MIKTLTRSGWMMPRKYTYEEAKEIVNNRGFKLISKEYGGYDYKLTLENDEGYLYYFSLKRLLANRIPARFHSLNPYTIQNIKLWCKLNKKSFELISDTYIDAYKNLTWKCLKNGCEEIFEMDWGHIHQNNGCPYCVGMKAGLSNCLATKNPELAKQWHPTLNGYLTPYDITIGYDKDVWWLCNKNSEHEWKVSIHNRHVSNSGCPYCAGQRATKENNLSVCNPELASEWDYDKNKDKPEDYTPNSGEDVYWICNKNKEHKWKTNISSRNKGNGCPYCAGKLPSKEYNLLVINPKLCEEWDYEKNDKKPEEYLPHGSQYVWWKCKKCNHGWYAKIASRNTSGCPRCNQSRGEKKIDEILLERNIVHINQYKFDDCKYKLPLPFDTFLSNYITCIEYQGLQHYEPVDFAGKGHEWAEEQFKLVKIKDKIKQEYCLNNNIKLITIPYWEYDNIEEILKKELGFN